MDHDFHAALPDRVSGGLPERYQNNHAAGYPGDCGPWRNARIYADCIIDRGSVGFCLWGALRFLRCVLRNPLSCTVGRRGYTQNICCAHAKAAAGEACFNTSGFAGIPGSYSSLLLRIERMIAMKYASVTPLFAVSLLFLIFTCCTQAT